MDMGDCREKREERGGLRTVDWQFPRSRKEEERGWNPPKFRANGRHHRHVGQPDSQSYSVCWIAWLPCFHLERFINSRITMLQPYPVRTELKLGPGGTHRKLLTKEICNTEYVPSQAALIWVVVASLSYRHGSKSSENVVTLSDRDSIEHGFPNDW